MIVTGLHKGIKLSRSPIYLSQADIFVLWLLYAFVISKEDWDAPVEERIDSPLILPSSSSLSSSCFRHKKQQQHNANSAVFVLSERVSLFVWHRVSCVYECARRLKKQKWVIN